MRPHARPSVCSRRCISSNNARQKRAETQNEFIEANKARAEAFRTDVITQVCSLQRKEKLREDLFQKALGLVKESRREGIADLIELATGGSIRLRP